MRKSWRRFVTWCRSLWRRLFMTDNPSFSDIAATHEHEEKLRTESMVLIRADRELSRRLAVIQKAMTVIFGYTVDHTSRNENEATVQLLGIRLFNAAASGMKLALSGYYQTAFQQARDIMETRIPARLLPHVSGANPGVEDSRPGDTPRAF